MQPAIDFLPHHPTTLPPYHPTTSLTKVAEGTFTRNRYAPKHVQLDAEGRCLIWDSGKKGVDLQTVLRVSVGPRDI